MKSLPGSVVLCLTVVGAVYAQSDPFNGTWKGIEEKSKRVTDRPVKQELIVFKVSNNTEQNINETTRADGSRARSEYTVTYNDGIWQPVKNLETGQPTGSTTMVIRIEPKRELRLIRRSDGQLGSMVLRTVLDDGKTMKIYTITPEAKVVSDLLFEKQP